MQTNLILNSNYSSLRTNYHIQMSMSIKKQQILLLQPFYSPLDFVWD